MPDNSTPLLEARNLSKRFLGVQALTDVSLTLGRGEVLALIGENGAGKSTLMKILAGVQSADEGEIQLDGKRVEFSSVGAALDAGIALIHQELNLADNLDVGSNIFLGREPRRGGFIDKKRIHADSRDLMQRVGLKCSPANIVGELSIGQQQMVEIAKALSIDARILIMDEPTSSLSQHETEHLFHVVRDLRARGISVIYISHRLGEVKELADRVVVLRDGRNAGELAKDEINHDSMVKMMVGRDLSEFYQRVENEMGDAVLQVENLHTARHPKQSLSFEVRAGEIVGIAGLVGAGRTELMEALFGIEPPLSGTVRIKGQQVKIHSPQDAIRAGFALVPEDRKGQGLILEIAIRENVGLPNLRRTQRGGFLNFKGERDISRGAIQSLNVKAAHDGQAVQLLSGGNQQKVVLGKWLAMSPQVFLLDEPTRGVDIGAKQEIYQLMETLASQGAAILFVSSEMAEIIGISDRVLVMHEGRFTGELKRDELSEESVMQLATGGAVAVG